MAAGEIRAGAAFVELFLKDSRLRKGLLAASKRLKAWGASVRKVGLSVVAAGGAITGALSLALNRFASVGDQLDKTSKRTGVAASALAELGFAAEQSGASMEFVEKGLFGLSRSVFDLELGLSTATDAFGALGIQLADIKGLAPEEQFQKVADALTQVSDESTRGAIAQKIFGRSGRQLLPMLADLGKLRQEARDLGLVPEDDAVKAAADVTDAFNRIKRVVGAVIFEVGAALAPAFLEISKHVVGLLANIGKWVRQNKSLVVTIAKIGIALTVAGGAILAIAGVLTGLGFAASGIATAIGLIGSVLGFVLSPLGFIAAGLAVATVAWLKFTSSGEATMGVLRSIGQTFRLTFGGIIDALKSGNLRLAASIAVAGLRLAFLKGFTALSDAVGGPFGDFLGSLGTKIAEGDLAGIWDTLMSGMVAAFSGAMKSIVGIWEKVNKQLSDAILASASGGGFFGRLLLMGTGGGKEQSRGLDPKEEARLRRKNIDFFKRELAAAQRELATLEGGGVVFDQEGNKVTIAEIQKYIANLQESLTKLGVPVDVLAGAMNNARDQITSTADEVRRKLDEISRKSKDVLAGGGKQAADALKKAEAELAHLLAEAAKGGSDDKLNDLKNKLATVNSDDAIGSAGRVQGTFNTVAAALFGAGQSAAERTAKATEQTAKFTKETRDRILQLALSAGIR